MRLLITQSLISSWNWAVESGSDDKFFELEETIRREPKPANEAMLQGIEFEKNVYELCNGAPRQPHDKWEPGIRKVAEIISGAQYQVSGYRELTVDGTDYLLYGIADAIRAGTIYDVKFSTKSFGSTDLAGKYLGSPQHPAYFRIWPEATKFWYVVSDGEDVYTEMYTAKDTWPIDHTIAEMANSFRRLGLWKEYVRNWEAKR